MSTGRATCRPIPPSNPTVAQQEAALLRALHAAGLSVPRPQHAGAGVLVTGFVEGEPIFGSADGAAHVRQMAAFLSRLHVLPPTDFGFLRPLGLPAPRPERPDDSLSERRIRDALDRFGTPLLARPAVLGSPLVDVANARLELLFFLGAQAMHGFTHKYAVQSGADLAALPYWDLRAALRPCGRLGGWGLEPRLEWQMRQRHAEFVDAALRSLSP